jgi:hypothetical protein
MAFPFSAPPGYSLNLQISGISVLKPAPPPQYKIVSDKGYGEQPWIEYFSSFDRILRSSHIVALVTPNNANAALAGVPLGGFYTQAANNALGPGGSSNGPIDPSPLYIRTV